MGLDMFLAAKRFYWSSEEPPVVADVPEGYKVQTVTTEAAYWRKSNQIHQWFVMNVQDGEDECRPFSVEHDQLRTLVDLCEQVIAAPETAEDILPTESGCFFGSTEYDEHYFADLASTVEMLEKALDAFDADKWSFEYCASW